MTTVAQILFNKPHREVCTVDVDDSVFTAISKLQAHNIGALVVTARSRVVGMLSERDYARKVILAHRSSKSTPVGDIMSRKVMYVEPDDTAEGCMALMTEKRIRHLPVFDKQQLIGIISLGDVVKAVVSQNKFLLNEMVRFITNSYTVEYPPDERAVEPAEERILDTDQEQAPQVANF